MKNPTIVVNARFLTQKISGVQRFAIELSLRLKKLMPEIIFVAPHNIYHHNLANQLGVITVGITKGHLWEQIDLPLFLVKHGNPFLINLANTAPVFYKNKAATVHDLAIYDVPESYSFTFRLTYKILLPSIIKNSQKIFTVSSFSQSRIKDRFGVNPAIIQNSVSSFFSAGASVDKEKIILAVSSLDPKKNFSSLIEAFIKANLDEYKLVIVGARNKLFDQVTLTSDNNIYKDKIVFTGHISDHDLASLYQRASLFIYPSFYEGFGIPPLEAMASGCPTIVSDIPSLREVCGDASVYVNPYDTADIANKLKEVCYNSELQAYLHKKGLENIRRFSWEDSSIKLMHYISEAMQ